MPILDFGSSAGSGGTVTDVALALPSIFTVSGSPVTASGTLTGTLATQAANLVFSGPTTGAAATPTFRSLVLADLPSGVGLTANPLSQFASTTSAQLAGVISNETGSGVLVFNDTPTLIAPLLGTPTSGVLTNCTGLPLASITGFGTNVATFLATPSSANLLAAVTDETGTGALVFGTSPVITTPTIASFTNATHTHLNAAGGGTLTLAAISDFGTGVATFLGTPTSANLAAAVTNETGSGALVFATSPTLVTPTLGVATATSLNGNTFTAGTYTLTGAASKTLTFSNTLTFAGTDATTMTFPTTSASIARTDAAQTFTGSQTIAALVGPVTITEAVGSSGLTITGATQVTSFPVLSLTQTWNAGAQIFKGIYFNVTKTAADNASALMSLEVGGSPKFSIGVSGEVLTALLVGKTGTQFSLSVVNSTNGATQLARDSAFGWTSSSGDASGTLDTILRRAAAATIQFGSDVNGAAVSQILQAANGITGSDKTGGNLTLASGKGTGAGAVSSLIFQTPTVLASGTTAQSLATRLTLDSANATFAVPVKLSNAAVTGLVAGVLAASTNASIVLVDSTGQAYRVPCII